jgi:hypothetical protein
MDKKTIQRRLWDSLEMHHYKVTLLVITVAFAIMFFPFLGRTTQGVIMTLLVFLPFYGFYIHRIFQIFRHPEEYIFTRCKLEKFHFSALWRTACFSVRLEIPEVGIVNDETALIFATHGIVAPVIEDYVNRKVLVGYNRTTGRIVVIG